jgi:hypothetical protein
VLLFLKKKKQKNFRLLRAFVPTVPTPAGSKSFLVLFFKKEPLAFFELASHGFRSFFCNGWDGA